MLTRIDCSTHEEVYRVTDRESGLEGLIAIHSTQAGPAAGGLRMRVYRGFDEALADVLALSRGMTYKNAAAGLPLGGGKAVILGDPRTDKTEAKLRAMGRAVAALEGRYWTAEDMGMSPEDMKVLAGEAEFVAGLADGRFASGDPSPITAQGVFNALKIGAARHFGSADLKGRRVAVQGLGHVGWYLCDYLAGEGAQLIVADTVAARVEEAQAKFGAELAAPDEIHRVAADVFAPCAIGGILNGQTVPELRASMICGAANNQLADDAAADALHARGILYLPDYVANGGGIINAATEILRIENRPRFVAERLAQLEQTMRGILAAAARQNTSPAHVADATVEQGMALRRAG
ncbi:Glu/Leu/Phe/Val family dehydrogenase [Marinovum algicola]|uniref:Glu/Leu/Phe/Val family dehydrogenase n=1 Tax=Marinovum algicola TaxID=42444 RepID=UPI0024BA8A55|nr:Glu/Leu/Phe/Val dehydrogenase dimerization domain-containing protein [Marinovum algicola]